MIDDFVLDASVALSWFFQDEQTKNSYALLDSLDHTKAFVPSLWSLEIANSLVVAVRRSRIEYSAIADIINMYSSLNILIDYETPDYGFKTILPLSHKENLSSYDAAYLELAMRLKLPLATKDDQLKKAAKKCGVVTLKV